MQRSRAELKYGGLLDAVKEVWQLAEWMLNDAKKVQSKFMQFRGTRIVSQKPIFYFSFVITRHHIIIPPIPESSVSIAVKENKWNVRGYR